MQFHNLLLIGLWKAPAGASDEGQVLTSQSQTNVKHINKQEVHLVLLCRRSMMTSTWAIEQLDKVRVTGTRQILEQDRKRESQPPLWIFLIYCVDTMYNPCDLK